MFTPRLAKVLETVVVSGTAAHSVKILRNKRMVIAWQGKPIHVDRPFVAGIRAQSEAYAASDGTSLGLHKVKQLANDDVGAGDSSGQRPLKRGKSRGFHIAVLVELCDLDGLHGCTDGDFARNCPGV